MLFTEVVLQGALGFPPQTQLPLRPGLNVLRVPDPARRRALIDLVFHALHPTTASPGDLHLHDPAAKQARVSITYLGRDGATYRLTYDPVRGSTSLARLDPEHQAFEPVSDRAQEISQLVRVQERMPDEVLFERFFTLTPDSLPSRGTRPRIASIPPPSVGFAPSAPGLPASPGLQFAPRLGGSNAPPRGLMQPSALTSAERAATGPVPPPSLNPHNAIVRAELALAPTPAFSGANDARAIEEKRLLHAQLRRSLEAVRTADRARQELSDLLERRRTLSQLGEQIPVLERKLDALQLAENLDPELKALPDDIGERVRGYANAKTRYDAEVKRLAEELREVQAAQDGTVVLPLLQDRYFVAGCAAAAAFVLLAIVVEKPVIALINILAAVVAAGAAIRYVGDLELVSKLKNRVRLLEDRQQRVEKQYELDTGVVRKLIKTLGVEEPTDLLGRVEEAEKTRHAIKEVRAELEGMRSNPSVHAAAEELKRIGPRIEELEAAILAADTSATGGLSASAIEVRVAALEAELAALGAPVPSRADIPIIRGSGPEIPVVRGSGPETRATSISGEQRSVPAAAPSFGSPAPWAPPQGTFTATTHMPSGALLAALGNSKPPPVVPDPTRTLGSLDPTPAPSLDAPPRSISSLDLQAPRSISSLDAPVTDPAQAPLHPGAATLELPLAPYTPANAMAPPPGGPRAYAAVAPPPGAPAPVAPPPPMPPPANAPTLPAGAPSSGSIGQPDIWDEPQAGLRGGAFSSNPSSASGPSSPGPAEDEEEGYGNGYGGGRGGRTGGPPGGGAATMGDAPWAGEVLLFSGGMPPSGPPSRGLPGSGGFAAVDRSVRLMQGASDLLHTPIDVLGQKLAPRLGQYLAALSGGVYREATFSLLGALAVSAGGGAPSIAANALEPEMSDLVDAALRLTVVEAAVVQLPVPVLIDDPFTSFDPKRRTLFQQMLGYLGKATQVILLTPLDDLGGNRIA